MRVRVCVRAGQGLAPVRGGARAGKKSRCDVHMCAHGGLRLECVCTIVRTCETGQGVVHTEEGSLVCAPVNMRAQISGRPAVCVRRCICTQERELGI